VIRRHLTYANVAATLALLFAIAGGAAYAVDKINSHDIVNGSIRSIDLKNRKAVRGADIKPNSLTGRQINETTLKPGSFARIVGNETGACVLRLAPRNCISTTIGMSRRSHLLVIATGNQESINGRGQASCRITIDGRPEPLVVNPGEAATDNTGATATNGFARTFFSKDALSAGQHTVALSCKRLLGGVRIDSPTIAAVAIGAG
jgi:hypothetical protein